VPPFAPLLEKPPLLAWVPPELPWARPPEATPPDPPVTCGSELEPHPVAIQSQSPTWPSTETSDLANISHAGTLDLDDRVSYSGCALVTANLQSRQSSDRWGERNQRIG
jgi:hypothetical protein